MDEKQDSPQYFKEPLVESGIDSRIKALKENPEKLVRFEPISDGNVSREIARHREWKQVLDKLNSHGVATSSLDVFVSHASRTESNQKTVVMITDRIHGQNLSEVTFTSEEAADAFPVYQKFFQALISYFIDCYSKKGTYFGDIKSLQFVYGKKQGDSENQIYLVDVEPFLSKHDPENVQNAFFHVILRILSMIVVAERKLSSQPYSEETYVEFSQERKQLSDFLNSLPPTILEMHDAKTVKEGLLEPKSALVEEAKKIVAAKNNTLAGWSTIEIY